MTKSAIRLSQLSATPRFVSPQAFVALVILSAIATSAAAPNADAFPNPGTSLKRQYENYKRETGEEAQDGTARALKKVPGPATNKQLGDTAKNRAERFVTKLQSPVNTNKQAKAKTQGQANQIGNCAADIARDQAVQAIDYCSRFMKNFTTEGGNRWNRYRDQLFLPLALLLILPGAVLTQVRAIIAQSNPVVGQASPLEGIQRAIITVFLVPATYLVCNYAIDVGNSLHYSICSEYTRLMGSDMYHDAMCAEIRAFGVRYQSENEGSLKVPEADLSPRGDEPFAKIEGTLWGKLVDPCVGLFLVPANRDDASMPQSSIAVRMGMYTANAGICAGWACLTAFQMAFFYYLYFVGPIMAALWAWPMKSFKDAFPNWVEGAVTLGFWSFFWQVTILILALTKAQASTGLYMVTALNVLATCSVKHAFDFAGIMRSAVGQAEAIGAEVASKAGSGGGGGGGGKGGGKSAGKGSHQGGTPKVGDTPEKVADTPVATPVKVAALVETGADDADAGRKPARVPAILTAARLPDVPGVVVQTSPPPAALTLASFSPATDSSAWLRTAWDDFGSTASDDINDATFTLNSTTGVWNDPIVTSGPPQAGPAVTANARNTIGSVLGNAIQEIMVYPTHVPIQDPDLINVVADKNQSNRSKDETVNRTDALARVELPTQAPAVDASQPESVWEDFSPEQALHSTPEQEHEMNSNDDPRIAALRDQRFNFPPPPMVSGQPAAGFAKVPTGVALTPQQLLSKLQTVAEAPSYAPPPPPVVTAPPSAASLYAFSLSQRQDNDTNFDVQEEAVVTVADFTRDLQGQSDPEPRQANLNQALSNVLRHRGAWAQAQSQVKPPVNQTVSTSWWS